MNKPGASILVVDDEIEIVRALSRHSAAPGSSFEVREFADPTWNNSYQANSRTPARVFHSDLPTRNEFVLPLT